MERLVDISADTRLWVQEIGDLDTSPLLLIMGANASSMTWPDALVHTLAAHHRVIRYDHRDTGRSSWAFDEHPYAVSELAEDAVAILDALDVERAHVVGMSMGGVLVQLLLLDHPDRLRSATVIVTAALGAGLAADPYDDKAPALPGPDPGLVRLWRHLSDSRSREEELAWRVEHWRILAGSALPFHAEEFRRLEERVIDHAGRHDNPAAHARAAATGFNRAAELACVRTPTLVIEGPEDPVNPPPHSSHLTRLIPTARLVTVPGMGHALSATVVGPVCQAILAHTGS
ncbi:MAG: alpha/beta hydrolase [Pseudonocardiales bacterium]|nr:alpha/beta hydrolase [Pseudonocardiales bacterium]MBV9031491.1 alpha/beta hydrolase [Pseudonocardiales bacterium]MBW0008806.1 alpha/beta hydrolase [Pseudonocardiales bacterium]